MTEILFHPLANVFPLIDGGEFAALVADIRSNGLIEPVDVYEGKILDGRNRYRAAIAADVTVRFRNFAVELHGDPVAYVISRNLNRRHLNESQRAMVAARIANLPHGGDRRSAEYAANLPLEKSIAETVEQKPPTTPAVTQATAARTLKISERVLRAARSVQEHGASELVAAVDRGKIAVSLAAKAARLKPEIQRRIAAEAEAGNANAARTVTKQEARTVRENDLGTRQCALPNKKYGVIVADPEWRFEVYSRESGMDRAADNHYLTSPIEVIATRDVQSIAADDCVLGLWATVPMLPDALHVMRSWGFEYKSHVIWHKDRMGNGYWFRNIHELLLIGTRGNVPAPAMGTQWSSVQRHQVGTHSEKPEMFLQFFEEFFPTLPKIELNRRGAPRPGWEAWGNEAVNAGGPAHDPDTGEIIETGGMGGLPTAAEPASCPAADAGSPCAAGEVAA